MTREAEAKKQFEAEVGEHVLRVFHDDGVYRHIRLQKPGTGIWHWDLVTWPGHLAITGDIGDGWSFSREHDMFTWFGTGEINPSYWWQKMPPELRAAAKEFSADALRQHAHESIAEWALDEDGIEAALVEFDAEWKTTAYEAEHEFRDIVRDFRFSRDGESFEFYDTWEWDAQEYDHHFLLALHAIVFGIRKYREYEAAIEAARLPLAA
jgi:hypothetical protein